MAKFPSTQIDKLIGQRIQQKRKEQGYSAEKLSEYVHISQPQLSRYERGSSKINVSHLVAIANFLNTPISYFFADCMNAEAWNTDELDQHWHTLSLSQKSRLAAFLQSLHD